MRRVFPAILGSALFLVLGCASRSGIALKTITPELLHKSIDSNRDRVRTLKGLGRITVETPEVAQSGSFELMLRKPDSVLVKLEGPFGIDVGSALLTRREFLFYNSFANKVITGSTNPANLTRILRVNLEFDDLIALFSGGTFLADDQGEPDTFAVQDEQYVLTYQHTHGERRYWVDPTSGQMTRIQHLDAAGRLRFEQGFSNFRTTGGVMVPFRIRMKQLDEGRAIWIAFSSVSVNTNSLPFTFTIPESAERIRWQ